MTPTGQTPESPHHGSSVVGMIAPTVWLLVALLLGISLGRVIDIAYWMPLTLALVLTVVAVIADRYARELNKARQNERRRETRRRWQAQTGQVPTMAQVQEHADKIDADERRAQQAADEPTSGEAAARTSPLGKAAPSKKGAGKARSDESEPTKGHPDKASPAGESRPTASGAGASKHVGGTAKSERADSKPSEDQRVAVTNASKGHDAQRAEDSAGTKRAERRAAQAGIAAVPKPKSAMGTASAPATTPLVDQSPKASMGARVTPTADQVKVPKTSSKTVPKSASAPSTGVSHAVPTAMTGEMDYAQPWGPITSSSPQVKSVSSAVPESGKQGAADAERQGKTTDQKTASTEKTAKQPARQVKIEGESLSIGEHLIVGGYGFSGKRTSAVLSTSTTVGKARTAVLKRSVSFSVRADTRHPVMRNFAHPQETFAVLPFTPRVKNNGQTAQAQGHAGPVTGSTIMATNTAGMPVVRRRDRRAAMKAKLDTGQLNVAELRDDFSRLAVAIDTQANQIVPPAARKAPVDVTDKATGQVPHSNKG